MARHIDSDELKEWIENWFYMNRLYHPYSKSNNIPISELYDILEQMSNSFSADVQDVVRCKDCKYYNSNECGFCEMLSLYGMSDNFFCADGKRRE